jgi:hypothetical protein
MVPASSKPHIERTERIAAAGTSHERKPVRRGSRAESVKTGKNGACVRSPLVDSRRC